MSKNKSYLGLDFTGNSGLNVKMNDNQKSNEYYKNLLFNKYFNIVFNRFVWEGLPDEINQRILERLLFYRGYAAFCKEGDTFLTLQATPVAKFDAMFDPLQWEVTGYNISGTRDFTNSVLIRNDYNGYPPVYFILYYVDKIIQVNQIITQNLNSLRAPYLISCTDDNIYSVKNMINNIQNGDFAVYLNKKNTELTKTDIEVLELKNNNYIVDLYNYKLELENELLTIFGIDNENITKESGVSDMEVQANDSEIKLGYIDSMLKMRQEACEDINKLFGLNVSCNLKKEEVDNGKLYNNTERTAETQSNSAE